MIEIGHINGIEKHLNLMHDNQSITTEEFKQLLKPIKQLNLKLFNKYINSHESS